MRPRVGVCDYGVGNLRSVERALRVAGAEPVVSGDPNVIVACDGVVLPGVGAFSVAAAVLRDTGLGAAVRELAQVARPVLGVCLGHQLLFEGSDEGHGGEGLALLRGHVVKLSTDGGLKVPHVGWNTITTVRASTLLDGIPSGSFMYFVHSYVAVPEPADVVAVAGYGAELAVAVQRDAVMGTQFHPEKSGASGLRIYANFVSLCAVRVPAQRAG
ncbi:MAG TPA: imidazole glycerol phosphate synthase subunit HisH [Candidatus Saccharimonadales bacterium]|nr:imidazole glycerol phosphate synthase subunit HisH [Candidatus Saccharimonadales bacterium]